MGSVSKKRPIEERRCHVCGQKSLRRVQQPYERSVSHDGRAPIVVHIDDLDVTACGNPDCSPEQPGDNVLLDSAAIERITEESYRQLGLLTPAEIRANRERLGYTQKMLQETLRLGGNSLSRWENGRVFQSGSMDSLLRIVFRWPRTLAFFDVPLYLATLEITKAKREFPPEDT